MNRIRLAIAIAGFATLGIVGIFAALGTRQPPATPEHLPFSGPPSSEQPQPAYGTSSINATRADTPSDWPEIAPPEHDEGLPFPRTGVFWTNLDEDRKIDALFREMSPEQIVGQVFLLGWDSDLPEGPILRWIRERNIGGVKIFGWNGRSVSRLAQTLGSLQEIALATGPGIPLFTATDQEGGWVRHVKDSTSITPGNMALGASGLPADAFLAGYYISRELRAIGINMNFAPTVDVYRNPLAHVIGPRAFSSDAELTARLGLSFFKGADYVRVISTAKHFPGHGNATGDSHGELPVVNDDLKDLEQFDLVPYRLLIDQGLPAILTGHLSFPQITGDTRPASLSTKIKSEILRGYLHFDGLAITDDLYMEGAWEYGSDDDWGIAEITLEALRAGNDLVMLSRTPGLNDRVWELVFAEYRSSPAFQSRIDESVRRILRWKIRYLYPPDRVPLVPDPAETARNIPYPGAQEFFAEQAARGTSIIAGEDIPLDQSFEGRTILVGQDPEFFSVGRRFIPNAAEYYFSYNPPYSADPAVVERVQSYLRNYDRVIFNLANQNSGLVLRSLADIPGAAEKIFVLSILTPAYLERSPWVRNAVAVYGWGRTSFEAGFSVLTGSVPGTGANPIPDLLSQGNHAP